MKPTKSYTKVDVETKIAEKLRERVPANMRRRVATHGVDAAIDIWIARHNPIPVIYPDEDQSTMS